jgi:hypothetical protein
MTSLTSPQENRSFAQIPKGRCAFCLLIAESMLQMQVDDHLIANLGLCANHRRSLETRDWLLRLYGDGPFVQADARDVVKKRR